MGGAHGRDRTRRHMIYACFGLGDLPGYRDVPLRRWAHMLGYGGHFSTKSRRYSVTLGALRRVRADHRAEEVRRALGLPEGAEEREKVVVQRWRYGGSGHRHGELTRQRIAAARRIAREREQLGPG
ncbi:replication initiator [Streptosporangium canum]|uniref:replication initiator n=1 Tax=Streptosporangium canum TaxID=324952 RepID=UPI003F4CC565